MGRAIHLLLLFGAFFGVGDVAQRASKLTLLNADVKRYAPFIVKALYHEKVAGTALSALSETEKPINGDSWYWTDDNAKSLEALSLDPVFSNFATQAGQITDFIIANSPPPFVFRRRADEHLDLKSDNLDDFRVATGLMNFHGNLRQADIRHGYRFHDDRTEDAVKYGASRIRFSTNGKVYTADSTNNIAASIRREEHAVTLTQAVDLQADSAIVGRATHTYRIEANKPYMLLTVEVRAAENATLQDVAVSTSLDRLESLHVRYSKFYSYPNASKTATLSCEGGSKPRVLKEGPLRWWSLIQEGDLGFSYAMTTLIDSPSRLKNVVSEADEGKKFRRVEANYELGTLARGQSASISEKKVLLAGGLYTSMGEYAGVFDHLDDYPGLDLSISYDIGAELNGVASAYLADKRRLERDPSAKPAIYKPETRQWFDAILDAYIAKFPVRIHNEYPYLFTRGHAYVVLALDTMYLATRDARYVKDLQHLANILLELQMNRGALADNFICVHHSFFLDCHASAMIAIARAAVATGDHRYAESAKRALRAYKFDPKAGTGNDVFFPQHDNAKDGDSYYWVFKAGLLLRSLEALEVLAERNLTKLSPTDWALLRELQRRAVAYVARTAHARGSLEELLTCHKAGETNSETQAWALLGLYPIEHERAEGHKQP